MSPLVVKYKTNKQKREKIRELEAEIERLNKQIKEVFLEERNKLHRKLKGEIQDLENRLCAYGNLPQRLQVAEGRVRGLRWMLSQINQQKEELKIFNHNQKLELEAQIKEQQAGNSSLKNGLSILNQVAENEIRERERERERERDDFQQKLDHERNRREYSQSELYTLRQIKSRLANNYQQQRSLIQNLQNQLNQTQTENNDLTAVVNGCYQVITELRAKNNELSSEKKVYNKKSYDKLFHEIELSWKILRKKQEKMEEAEREIFLKEGQVNALEITVISNLRRELETWREKNSNQILKLEWEKKEQAKIIQQLENDLILLNQLVENELTQTQQTLTQAQAQRGALQFQLALSRQIRSRLRRELAQSQQNLGDEQQINQEFQNQLDDKQREIDRLNEEKQELHDTVSNFRRQLRSGSEDTLVGNEEEYPKASTSQTTQTDVSLENNPVWKNYLWQNAKKLGLAALIYSGGYYHGSQKNVSDLVECDNFLSIPQNPAQNYKLITYNHTHSWVQNPLTLSPLPDFQAQFKSPVIQEDINNNQTGLKREIKQLKGQNDQLAKCPTPERLIKAAEEEKNKYQHLVDPETYRADWIDPADLETKAKEKGMVSPVDYNQRPNITLDWYQELVNNQKPTDLPKNWPTELGRIPNLETEIEKLRANNTDLTDQLTNTNRTLTDKEDEITTLSSQLTAEKVKQKEEVDQLKKDLDQQKKERESLQDLMGNKDKENEKLKSEFEQIRREKEKLTKVFEEVAPGAAKKITVGDYLVKTAVGITGAYLSKSFIWDNKDKLWETFRQTPKVRSLETEKEHFRTQTVNLTSAVNDYVSKLADLKAEKEKLTRERDQHKVRADELAFQLTNHTCPPCQLIHGCQHQEHICPETCSENVHSKIRVAKEKEIVSRIIKDCQLKSDSDHNLTQVIQEIQSLIALPGGECLKVILRLEKETMDELLSPHLSAKYNKQLEQVRNYQELAAHRSAIIKQQLAENTQQLITSNSPNIWKRPQTQTFLLGSLIITLLTAGGILIMKSRKSTSLQGQPRLVKTEKLPTLQAINQYLKENNIKSLEIDEKGGLVTRFKV